MNLVELLPRTDGRAIIDRRRALTFAELDRVSGQFAAELRAGGVRAGDHALILQPVSVELYVALLGVLRLGAVAMFLDPSAGREHIARCCAIQPPRALLGSRQAMLLRWTVPALRRIPIRKVVVMPVAARTPAPQGEVADNAPALLTFTSGSTGQPKAALRTHGFLMAQHRVLAATLGLVAGEVDLTTLPVFVLSNLASGVTSLLPDADLRRPGAISPEPVLAQIKKYRPTSTAASPAFLERLVCRPLPSFRRIFTGGAPVFLRLLDKLHEVAPQAEIVSVYGSTEAEPMAHASREEIIASTGRGLLAGGPVPQVELRVVRDEWGEPRTDAVSLPGNETGEIIVAGEHVLSSYLRAVDDAESKFDAEGRRWHRTGDAGYLDEQGRLWLLGRCAAKVVDEQGTLYPFAVECAAQPWRSAFVRHADRRVLVVEPDAPRDIKDRLGWAKIAEVRVVGRIPLDKRHNAKVDYPALYRLLDDRKETM